MITAQNPTSQQSSASSMPDHSAALAQIDEALASLQTKSNGLDIDFLSTALSNARTTVADSLHRATAAAEVPTLQAKMQELASTVELRTSELSKTTAALATFETITAGIKAGLLGKIELAYEPSLRQGMIAKISECNSPKDLIQLSLEVTLAFNTAWAKSNAPEQFAPDTVHKEIVTDPSIFSTRRK
jgi:hypothetical protein